LICNYFYYVSQRGLPGPALRYLARRGSCKFGTQLVGLVLSKFGTQFGTQAPGPSPLRPGSCPQPRVPVRSSVLGFSATAASSNHLLGTRYFMEEQILLKNKFSYLLPICDRPSTLTSYSICDQLHILTSLLLSTTPLLQQDRVDTACQRDGLPAAVASHHLSPPALSHVKRDLLQCQKRPITAIPTSHHGHGLCNSTQHLLKFNRSSPRGLFCCPPVPEGFETRGLHLTLRSKRCPTTSACKPVRTAACTPTKQWK